MLVGLALEGIEEVELVHLGVEEVVLRFLHSEHEGRVGHVDVHLLDDETFGALTSVFVGTLTVTFVLPGTLSLTLLSISCPYIRHDAVDGLSDALLARACGGAEDIHERGLVLHIVDVAESHLTEVGG